MKKHFILSLLFVAIVLVGSFAVTFFTQKTPRAEAVQQKVKGYLWSANTGWISLSCENINVANCNPTNYQVTLDTGTNELSGLAWSNQLGWLDFDAGCPAGTPGTEPPCSAQLVGGQLQGWARFVTNTPGVWDGWVSFSSANDTDPNQAGVQAGVNAYGATLSGNILSGYAWGSTGVGWLQFVDVTIEVINLNANLQLKPSDVSGLPFAQVDTLPNTLTLPGAGNLNLYWYTTDPTANYTSCTASSDYASTWIGYSPLIPVSVAPNQPNETTPVNFVTYTNVPLQKYTLSCTRALGGVDYAEAYVSSAGVGDLQLRAREVGNPPLTMATAPTAPDPISVPQGTTNVDLFWWRNPGSPNYTSCTASSSPGTTWTGNITFPAYAPPLLPPNNPVQFNVPIAPSVVSGGTQTYGITCTDGVTVDTTTATVNVLGPAGCNVITFSGPTNPCPPGTPGYVPPTLDWLSAATSQCYGTATNAPTNWLTNPPANTAGSKNISAYANGTTFDITCDAITAGTCTAPSYTLNYLPANDPQCQNVQVYQCSDGIDNDGDGFIDFSPTTWTPAYAAQVTPPPAVDPGCTSGTDNSEFNLKTKVKEN